MKKLLFITSIFLSVIITAQNFTIVLDAGHGGDDKGAQFEGISEAQYNLEFTQLVANELNKFNKINVIETRTSDVSVNLSERLDIINESNPNLLISFHLNSSDNPSVNGFDIWIPKQEFQAQSEKIGEALAPAMAQFGLVERGIQESGFKLVNDANCPALLIDLGFIENEHDRTILESRKQSLAKAIAKYLLMISNNY